MQSTRPIIKKPRRGITLKLRQRLGLAFGVMFLFVLAATATGMWYANMAQRELALAGAGSTQIDTLYQTRLQWFEISSTIDSVMLTRSPDLLTQTMAAKTERFRETLSGLPLQNALMWVIAPEGQAPYNAAIRDLQAAGSRLSEIALDLQTLVLESRWDEAEALYWNELIPLQDEFQSSIRRLIATTQADMAGLLDGAERTRNTTRLYWILVSGLTMGAGLALAYYIARSITRPVDAIIDSARRVSAGDFSPVAPLDRTDEIGDLSRSFSAMTDWLRGSYETLEQRVAARTKALEDRTRQIQTAARIAAELARPADTGTETAGSREVHDILESAVNLILNEFDFYHAGIFLIDDRKEYAVLQAATGEAGRKMLQNRHRLAIAETGVVGHVAARGTARIAQDVGTDAAHFRNPLLPDTRSEIALPIKSSSRMIGVLDVQSNETNAFSQEDITVLQIIADQLATAIENALLVDELRKSLHEQQALYRQLSREAWKQVPSMLEARGAGVIGFRYDRFAGAKPLLLDSPDVSDPVESQEVLQIPLTVRGVEIGALEVWPSEGGQGPNEFSDQERQLLARLGSRLSQALESARLFEETQRRMAREQTINRLSASFSRSLNMDDLLRTAVEELQRITPALEIAVHVGPADFGPQTPSGNGQPLSGSSSQNGEDHD